MLSNFTSNQYKKLNRNYCSTLLFKDEPFSLSIIFYIFKNFPECANLKSFDNKLKLEAKRVFLLKKIDRFALFDNFKESKKLISTASRRGFLILIHEYLLTKV